VNDQWIWTNRTNAWQNLMYTVSVNLAGYDDVFITSARVRSAIMTVTSFSRGTATHGKLLPQSCSRAWWIKRVKTGRWKTIFSTLAAGAMSANRRRTRELPDLVRDLANGEYKLPWDENVKIRDGWKYYPDGVQLGPLPK
jgi:hypothetical protein